MHHKSSTVYPSSIDRQVEVTVSVSPVIVPAWFAAITEGLHVSASAIDRLGLPCSMSVEFLIMVNRDELSGVSDCPIDDKRCQQIGSEIYDEVCRVIGSPPKGSGAPLRRFIQQRVRTAVQTEAWETRQDVFAWTKDEEAPKGTASNLIP